MTFLEELLKSAVRDGEITVNISFEADDIVKVLEGKCYSILSEISEIIRDNSIDDPECFHKVERLVCLFEEYGLDTGGRHDF